MRYQQVIWDWNGTLLDDKDICVDIMNRILSRRALPPLSTEKYCSVFGFPVKDYYRRLGFDFRVEPFEDISLEYITAYQKSCFQAKLSDGALGALENCRRAGISQIILSATEQEFLEQQVAFFGIRHYFRELLGLDNCHAAGKVELAREWMANQELDFSKVILVGDTVHDFEVASAIGCQCALLSTGHQSRDRLKALGVPVFGGFHELEVFLESS